MSEQLSKAARSLLADLDEIRDLLPGRALVVWPGFLSQDIDAVRAALPILPDDGQPTPAACVKCGGELSMQDGDTCPDCLDPAASAAYQPGPGNCVKCGMQHDEIDHNGTCPICGNPDAYQAGIVDAGTAFLAYIKSLEDSGRQLLAAVDAMRLTEPTNEPPGPYWLGPFGDWSQEFDHRDEPEVGVNWPILVSTCTHLRGVLDSAVVLRRPGVSP